ncbi:MAG TPA: AAA family ATPase, partial [Ramlibacter sp.]|nr:AAA family ATPase [Ramlibacter sp.]
MKINTIELESFKRFRKRIVLSDFSDGLNLFTAVNEGGKSTIAEAIRAAFLERHRTSTLVDLVPWGESGASPNVHVEFTVAGQRCSVRKAFLSRKSCDVAIGDQTLSGEEAENKLGELLGFGHAAKGKSTEEKQGIPGLLWIRQGRSYNITDEVRHASDYLRRALSQSVGELAATQGDTVLNKVAEERGKLLTK